ncbi:AmmeMemoRadiSam system protein B [Uliginosibacterium paludis]|uniref:MEMO1 family protein ABVT11_04255 n=1 Tax=Uliginosibacterium paludis TaxID=1615952 RepID=A0ABV2CM85_9RHOO
MPSQPVRPPAAAGLLYPADPAALTMQIHGLLARAERQPGLPPPKAIIVPHAGYLYSGAVAASAYAMLESLRSTVRRVILIGPSHHHAFAGIAIPCCAAFETPLDRTELDSETIFSIANDTAVVFDDAAHAREHSLEVQLPFLQTTLDHFKLLPLAIGTVTPEAVAALLDKLWGGPETLIVISSDLSHHHDYPQACEKDSDTMDRLLGGTDEVLQDQACAATAINALQRVAQARGLMPRVLDLRNSGDTAGERNHVVGYAAICFTPALRYTH